VANGVIMTRLDVRFTPDATTAQINAALVRIDGGIVTMTKGRPAVTIAIPRPADPAALARVAAMLNALPGISRASLAHEAQFKKLPGSSVGLALTGMAHLIPSFFPAAWNASRLATEGCATRKVKVVIGDHFDTSRYSGFFDEIPRSSFQFDVPPTALNTHGDEVTTTLAARFDPLNPTGAVPFPECLEIHAIAVDGLSTLQRTILFSQKFPAGKFLMNYSIGYSDLLPCLGTQTGCDPADPLTALNQPLDRAYDAIDWKSYTSDRWGDFLFGVAGGNEWNQPGTAIYPGLGVAPFDSPMSVATIADPFFSFVQDASMWDPQTQPGPNILPSIAATAVEKTALDNYIRARGPGATAVPDNVVMVGAMGSGPSVELLTTRPYSDSGSDVSAVAEDIFTLTDLFTEGGTSLATPQVTGLAAYLWLVSSGAHAKSPALIDLSALPSSVTRGAILANARASLEDRVIDAYSSVLSLDAAASVTPETAPVRLALLDVDDNGAFDEDDLAGFVQGYFDSVTGEAVAPPAANYGRYDLNGDGLTGGPGIARFDLDRVGSTQFGAARYSHVSAHIGDGFDEIVPFDESALTDLQILCYYAYSPLYTARDHDLRDELLGRRCVPIAVTVTPQGVSLKPGATQQFAASVRGASDPRVTWTASGGTIASSGLFTAGNVGGTFIVRAASLADPNVFGDASVTVTSITTQCGNQVTKQLLLGNHTVTLETDRNNESGTLTSDLPGPNGFASGSVSLRSISVSADDPDTTKDVDTRGRITGVGALATFIDTVTLMPVDQSLIGQDVTFTLPAAVSATTSVGGDHARAAWSLNVLGGVAQGVMSTIAGRSNGDPSGGNYSVTVPAFLGFPFSLGGTLSAVSGLDAAPGEPLPPLHFTGAATVRATLTLGGIVNVRDRAGRPVAVTVCSAGGESWSAAGR
jgi:hypothetical protein